MGNYDPQGEQKQKALEEFRSHSVGTLLNIIDQLANMGLSIPEMKAILLSCGLDDKNCVQYGYLLKSKKERGSLSL